MKRKKIIEKIKSGKMAIKKDNVKALKSCLSYLFPHDKQSQNKEIINDKSNVFYGCRWYDTSVWRGYPNTEGPYIGALELLIKIKGAHAISEMYKAQARRIDKLEQRLNLEDDTFNTERLTLSYSSNMNNSIDSFIINYGKKFCSMKIELLKSLSKLNFRIEDGEIRKTSTSGACEGELLLTHGEIEGVLKIKL